MHAVNVWTASAAEAGRAQDVFTALRMSLQAVRRPHKNDKLRNRQKCHTSWRPKAAAACNDGAHGTLARRDETLERRRWSKETAFNTIP